MSDLLEPVTTSFKTHTFTEAYLTLQSIGLDLDKHIMRTDAIDPFIAQAGNPWYTVRFDYFNKAGYVIATYTYADKTCIIRPGPEGHGEAWKHPMPIARESYSYDATITTRYMLMDAEIHME